MKFNCDESGIYDLTALKLLTNLSLADNSLTLNVMTDCSQFPISLKHIDLHGNCISNEEINNSILFFNRQIEIIDAKDQSRCVFMDIGVIRVKPKHHRQTVDHNLKDSNRTLYYGLERFVFTNSTEKIAFGNVNDKFPRLKHLDLSLNKKGSETLIPYFFSQCRPELELLNVSSCRIIGLEEHSFSNFSKLKTLDISDNMLRKMGCALNDIFWNLRSLQELNLADNGIDCVRSYLFDGMGSIHRIDMSGNEIQHFDVRIKNLKNLEHLNLSGNRLEKLSDTNMEDLDHLAISRTVHLDLYGNSLLCNCDTLKFLRWMQDTAISFNRRDRYKCILANGKEKSLKDLHQLVGELTPHCSSKTILIVTTSAIIACSLVSICGLLVYRFRWRIRYVYYKTKMKIPYKSLGPGYEHIFDYDVFISYATDDHQVARHGSMSELEAKRGLRACIHERDFRPGESIAFNISKGIHNSKRTILFLSKAFLASEWCMYEFNIARMEALHTGRKIILVVMLEDIPSKTIPVDVLDIIDTTTYLEYPMHKTQEDVEVFWSKCADFITGDC